MRAPSVLQFLAVAAAASSRLRRRAAQEPATTPLGWASAPTFATAVLEGEFAAGLPTAGATGDATATDADAADVPPAPSQDQLLHLAEETGRELAAGQAGHAARARETPLVITPDDVRAEALRAKAASLRAKEGLSLARARASGHDAAGITAEARADVVRLRAATAALRASAKNATTSASVAAAEAARVKALYRAVQKQTTVADGEQQSQFERMVERKTRARVQQQLQSEAREHAEWYSKVVAADPFARAREAAAEAQKPYVRAQKAHQASIDAYIVEYQRLAARAASELSAADGLLAQAQAAQSSGRLVDAQLLRSQAQAAVLRGNEDKAKAAQLETQAQAAAAVLPEYGAHAYVAGWNASYGQNKFGVPPRPDVAFLPPQLH